MTLPAATSGVGWPDLSLAAWEDSRDTVRTAADADAMVNAFLQCTYRRCRRARRLRLSRRRRRGRASPAQQPSGRGRAREDRRQRPGRARLGWCHLRGAGAAPPKCLPAGAGGPPSRRARPPPGYGEPSRRMRRGWPPRGPQETTNPKDRRARPRPRCARRADPESAGDRLDRGAQLSRVGDTQGCAQASDGQHARRLHRRHVHRYGGARGRPQPRVAVLMD